MNRLPRLLWSILFAPLACASPEPGNPEDNAASAAEAAPAEKAAAARFKETHLNVFRPNTGQFHAFDLRTGVTATSEFRGTGVPVRMTRANTSGVPLPQLYHPGTATFYSGDGSKRAFGRAGDIPVTADYDGDGLDDFAVWSASDGTWTIEQSFTGRNVKLPFGSRGDLPVPGDYDGDGSADIAYFNPPSGNWYAIRSSDGAGVTLGTLGGVGHKVAQADYDGDGKTDLATYVPWDAEWWVARSSDGVTSRLKWGQADAIPVPSDYDGDGKADHTYWEPATGVWRIMMSSVGRGTHFTVIAGPGDIPLNFKSIEPTWLIDGAIPSVTPPPPAPSPTPPPSPPPPPRPTHGQVFAKYFLDTSGGTFSCGSVVFSVDSPRQFHTAEGTFTAEGSKPGLRRCRYDAMFWKVDPGARTVCVERVGCRTANVSAGNTTVAVFE